MKIIRLTVIISLLLISLQTVIAQSVVFSPEKPSPGEVVKVTYDPTATPLNGHSFEAVAYLFEDDQPQAIEMVMEQMGDEYVGTIETHTNTQIVFVSFSNEELGKTDDNEEKGYKVKMFTADKSKPVAGAYANATQAYRYLRLKKDAAANLKYLKKEFANHPSDKYWVQLAQAAMDTSDEEALGKVKQRMADISQNRKASEKDLTQAYNIARVLKDQEKLDMLAEKTKKSYPKGDLAMGDFSGKFYEARELDEKLTLYNTFQKKFKGENAENTLQYMASQLASTYARQNDWDNFSQYMSLVNNRSNKASVYNNLAWSMSGQSLKGEAKNIEMGMKLSAESLALMKAEMNEPDKNKPSYFTTNRWKKNLAYSYGMFADTYALLSYKAGNAKQALEYQKIANANMGEPFHDAEMNERYCVYLEEVEGPEKAEMLLEKLVRKGVATGGMKSQYKELFMKNNSIEEAFDKYMAELGKAATARQRKELEEKMIDMEAPAFTLKGLDGKTYTLQDLRGKVLVLDFWATWCGPCIMSFPGMQTALNDHKDQDDVMFLFIDTWESEKDKEKNAEDFLAQNKYTFNVLMDNDSKVVESFGVSGIPTKFVLDKNGRIRFKSIGYNGNVDELVVEMKLMIELAKAASSDDFVNSTR